MIMNSHKLRCSLTAISPSSITSSHILQLCYFDGPWDRSIPADYELEHLNNLPRPGFPGGSYL